MRVLMACFENPATFMGGVEVHAVELVRQLNDLGHDVTLATRAPDEGDPPEDPWGIPVEWIDVPLPRGPLPSYHHHRLMRPIFHRGIAALADATDLVHSQDDAGFGALGEAPVVTTVHTDVVSEYEAAKKPLPQGLPQRAAVTWDRLQWRRWADQLAAAIAVSPATADALSTHFGLDPVVIPNGLDPVEPIPQAKARDATGTPFDTELLYFGRLAPVKRVDRLLGALAYLPDEVGLTIAGKGPARDTLEAQVDKLGLADRVRFLGYVAEEEKGSVLASADALALPSEHEGQPIVLLEALQQGLPLVVTELGWLPEPLQHHARAAPLDLPAEALADRLLDALEAGRVQEAKILSWREVAERTAEVYASIRP